MDMRCPRCQNQQTTKATAIINAGNTTGTTSGSGMGLSFGMRGVAPAFVNYNSTTHVQSMLASKLTPPQPPRKASPALAIAFAIIFSVLSLCSLCPLFLVIVDKGNTTDPTLQAENASFAHSTYISTPIVEGVFLVGIALCIVSMVLTAPRRKARYQEQLARWQRAMYNWDQLYYCGVCDSVYLQHSKQVAPLDHMYGLLFNT